jgi:thiamine-phosphate pyrophosphorylase
MPDRTLLYYITDRSQFPGDEASRRKSLLAKINEAAQSGVDYIQLREKDLPAQALEELAGEAARVLNDQRRSLSELSTILLVNSRTDVALAVGAGGVHLRADDISPAEARRIWNRSPLCAADTLVRATISVSCHQPDEIEAARTAGADLALFAPVFGKKDTPTAQPTGLTALTQACRSHIPVLALGGITLENASRCLEAGATGVAAIRLFQENNIAAVVRALRAF